MCLAAAFRGFFLDLPQSRQECCTLLRGANGFTVGWIHPGAVAVGRGASFGKLNTLSNDFAQKNLDQDVGRRLNVDTAEGIM